MMRRQRNATREIVPKTKNMQVEEIGRGNLIKPNLRFRR